MTAFDFIVIGIVGLSTLFAFARGFVRVAISLAAWVIALVAAFQYADAFAAMLPAFGGGTRARYVAAFVVVVAAVLLIGGLLGWLLSRLVRAVGLGFIDRSLGAVLGVARGLLIVVIGVLVAGLTTLPRQEWWRNAMFAPPLVDAALGLRPWLPQAWAEQLDFPKAGTRPAKTTAVRMGAK
ncbi:MAG: CvpA family protein [Casimicrobiaceae bacterium]